jgi:NADPH:quinone reductase-like Zn-dependent oxidoreductase
VVDRIFQFDHVAEAFEHLVADRNVGKIVLAWSGR